MNGNTNTIEVNLTDGQWCYVIFNDNITSGTLYKNTVAVWSENVPNNTAQVSF